MKNTEGRIGRPANADSAETERRVLDAAVERVATLGYAGASIREIAAAAGVTSATLYHYFSSKEHLVEAAATGLFAESYARLTAVTEQHPTLPEQLSAHLEETYRIIQDQPLVFPFLAALEAAAEAVPQIAGLLADYRTREWRRLKQLVRTARERGEVSDGVDDDGLVYLCSSLVVTLGRLPLIASPEHYRTATEAACALLTGRLFTPRPSN